MTARLENAVRKLSPEQVREVEDFAEFLAGRDRRNPMAKRGAPKFDWVGSLRHIDDAKSSVELIDEATASMGTP
jgi:hypothetical protein